MSGLTRCNRCTLESMKERAKKRGVELEVRVEDSGNLKGWTSVRYSDKRKPSAWFLSLTETCAC